MKVRVGGSAHCEVLEQSHGMLLEAHFPYPFRPFCLDSQAEGIREAFLAAVPPLRTDIHAHALMGFGYEKPEVNPSC